MVCDLTLSDSTGVFGQVGPRMGSFDGGYGVSRLVGLVGQKKAREVWFMCGYYGAEEAERIGLVNKVVEGGEWPVVNEGVRWARR